MSLSSFGSFGLGQAPSFGDGVSDPPSEIGGALGFGLESRLFAPSPDCHGMQVKGVGGLGDGDVACVNERHNGEFKGALRVVVVFVHGVIILAQGKSNQHPVK
jgi:hypothetical protein